MCLGYTEAVLMLHFMSEIRNWNEKIFILNIKIKIYGSNEILQKRQWLYLIIKRKRLDGVYENIEVYIQLCLVCEKLLYVSLEKFLIKSYILFKWYSSCWKLPKQRHVLVLQILTPVWNQKKISCDSFNNSYGFA